MSAEGWINASSIWVEQELCQNLLWSVQQCGRPISDVSCLPPVPTFSGFKSDATTRSHLIGPLRMQVVCPNDTTKRITSSLWVTQVHLGLQCLLHLLLE
ncbi:hypothetical protein ATANTOWER_018789 [Ataeniobius toweri]|uniref:Uncharacterized protein n=1 Tax=Ataeniobius toweri TaxID=208326 RepID=A0ABU7B9P8_9TELE|nr:hypothetical protein [Ataeniobius toweri]